MANSPSLIEDGLYLGDMSNANNRPMLEGIGITHVLTVCSIKSTRFPSMEYKQMKIADNPSEKIDKLFEEAFDYINRVLDNGGLLLVHCFAGVSRSASIVISYIMKKYGYTYETALNYVKSKRSVINPNLGFTRQLRSYADKINS